ncbi:MATE family efflux transporter [Bacteroides sp. KH365_2]|uniref:MATE family efflux transporter n=1 Tax=Bacteroides muris (ex Fokt et al. 2023) TaxID=2937417 RepID=A0A9X2NQK9_9BACE|nr:MATE family efflux transporter [Bacteroides muris (ex Fokt et al. 2023)]
MQGTKNLTQGPINRQLFTLAMPIMATSFIQMAYSLTDMAWVGRLGSESVAAVGAVGILTWMSGSIALLNKVGAEVSVSQSIFYGLGRTIPPAIVSIGCNYMRIPVALLLVHMGMGVDAIWWAVSGTTIAKGLILTVWFISIKRRIL